MAFIWKEHTTNIITVFASESADVSIFYKKRGSSVAMTKVSEELIYRGDGVWEVNTTLPAGDYVIRIIIVEGTATITDHYRLRVLTEQEYYNDGLMPRFVEWG
jgi:hypothetical protein